MDAVAITRAAAPALTRGLATKKKKKKPELDLGWWKFEEKWTAIDVEMPSLQSFEAFGDRSAFGHSGMRKFMQSMGASLKWQNPEASFALTQNHRGLRDGKPESLQKHDLGQKAVIRLSFEGGAKHELDVTGMMQHDILRLVLTTAGVEESRADEAVRVRLEQIADSWKERRRNPALLGLLEQEVADPEEDAAVRELEAGDETPTLR